MPPATDDTDSLTNPKKSAFLSFSLGPVQSFIESARTVRDLWTGSYLLAWLTYKATEPILHGHGADAIIFPALEGNPLVDWLGGDSKLSEQARQNPCIPNRFLAELPDETTATALAQDCIMACDAAWRELHSAVQARLLKKIEAVDGPDRFLHESWSRAEWQRQLVTFFEIRTSVLPWHACGDAAIQDLSGTVTAESSDADELWTRRWQLAGGLLQASRSVRHLPCIPPRQGDVPQKCTILGSYEQMGPAKYEEARDFWQSFSADVHLEGTWTGENEKLCAVSLVKRYAWPAFLARKLGLPTKNMRFSDTATVAAKYWLKDAPSINVEQIWEDSRNGRQRWNGEWLHWSRPDEARQRRRERRTLRTEGTEEKVPDDVWKSIVKERARLGDPPVYYAILMLDGDNMGKILQGGPGRWGRERHHEISKVLAGFAVDDVPRIVSESHGELIYAGGDDALALLPTATALQCAAELNRCFTSKGLWKTHVPDGLGATVSAGIAVVHYKEDLRFALRRAREAEKAAKRNGRDALMLTVCRRSGGHTSALCGWEQVAWLTGWVRSFLAPGVSDRWAYHLTGELPTLEGLDSVPAIRAEIRRQIRRAEESTRREFDPEKMADLYGDYCEFRLETKRRPKDREFRERFRDSKSQDREIRRRALRDFVTLCQSASFLARGRDC